MSRLDVLREARQTYAVCWRAFLLDISKHPDALHCFHEGKDAKYYLVRIELLADVSPKTYECGGKPGVLRVIDLYRSRFKELKCSALFFIDQDFDSRADLPAEDFVYITDAYSIENHYVSRVCIEKVLRNEFGLASPDSRAELERLTDLVDKRLDEVANALLDLNAWLAARREVERTASNDTRLSLAAHRLSDFVDVSLGSVSRRYKLAELSQKFKVPAPPPSLVSRWRSALSGLEPRRFLRGKYLLNALRDLLSQLQEDRRSKSPTHFSAKGTASLQLSKSNLISELSQYADTPDCLRDFITRRAA